MISLSRIKGRWEDFIFENLTVKRHQKILLKKLKEMEFFFVGWDISDSSIGFLFAQFEMFYEKYNSRFFPVEETAMDPYNWELQNNNVHDEETLNQIKDWCLERKKNYKIIDNIHNYISINRAKNKKILENIFEEMYKDVYIYSEKIKEGENSGFYELKSNKEPKNFNITWSFNEQGLADVKHIEVEERNLSYYNYEDAMYEKDNEFAKMIIDIRGYLWD